MSHFAAERLASAATRAYALVCSASTGANTGPLAMGEGVLFAKDVAARVYLWSSFVSGKRDENMVATCSTPLLSSMAVASSPGAFPRSAMLTRRRARLFALTSRRGQVRPLLPPPPLPINPYHLLPFLDHHPGLHPHLPRSLHFGSIRGAG